MERNLVIIIGNGFDLAHGLPTSYKDFSKHLLNLLVERIHADKKSQAPVDPGFYKKEFLKHVTDDRQIRYHGSIPDFNGLEDSFAICYRYMKSIEDFFEFFTAHPNALRFVLGNKFLGKLFSGSYTNWFDIEEAYFNELKVIVKQYQHRPSGTSLLIQLNQEFEQIKVYLIEYLKTVELKSSDSIRKFFEREVSHYDQICIVNFNYTETFNFYADGYTLDPDSILSIPIHGDLINGDIIFGYGNDLDKNYHAMKESGNDHYLTHFKTFQYLRNDRYQGVHKGAIDKLDYYDVYVLGHSLGATDKTLLKEIFETEKCERIYLFKRGDILNDEDLSKAESEKKDLAEFNKLIYALGRIVESDRELRNKVVNYQDSRVFP